MTAPTAASDPELRCRPWIVLVAACLALAGGPPDSQSKSAEAKKRAAASSKSASPTAKSKPQPKLDDALRQLLAKPALKGTQVGLHVVRLSDGHALFANDADRPLIPASNQKLLTTAAALTTLGADYEFRTQIGFVGDDLVVVGGGDPTIGGRFGDGDVTASLRQWAAALKKLKITRVAGDIVVDDSFFDREFLHPHWPKNDLGHWYAAPIAALAINDNLIDVRIAPGPDADSPGTVSISPATRFFRIDNRTHTVASSKDHAPRCSRRPGSNTIVCEGGVYRKAAPITGWVTIDDPPLVFGQVLREVLEQEGITVAGEVRRESAAGRSKQFRAKLVHRFKLLPALAVTNKESQNYYAEQILKVMGAERGGEGSWAAGRRVAERALSEIGLDPGSFTFDDGCGLSRSNRVTPLTITTLLTAMHRGPHGDAFRGTLSVAGVDGTLAKRLADDAHRGRVFAKTGSITGARAISGYVQSRDGGWLAFSFLVNDVRLSVRDLQDELCRLLVDSDQG